MNAERWQLIDQLFHAALARRAPERPTFLAENCAGEDDLRREIEALIASHELPDNFIERDACDLAAEMLAGGGSIVVEGQTLGPYKILELLGAGGMGQVFRATDTRLHRTVTIKILPPETVSNPDRKRRLLQEARAASALNHPNIVTLYDIAKDRETDYLVMEYVEGKSLDKLIAAKRLGLADVIAYGAQIAGALAAAHSAGIVHRDIKPGNVIVNPQSQVKVLDFGLAKLEPEKSEETETVEGGIMGTPAYMSPEQASGRQVDHRTDIFSFGVMLYEMIAGKRPFAGKSYVDTMHQIIHAPAPPLAKVPRRLADIVEKALAKDPQERYQNAGDLAVDLRRFLNKTDSHSPSATRRARRVAWIVAALVMVVGVVAWLALPPPYADPLKGVVFTTLTDWPGEEASPALSPKGDLAAFLSDHDGALGVWVKEIGGAGRLWKLLDKNSKNVAAVTVNRSLGFTADESAVWRQGKPSNRFRLLPIGGGDEKLFLVDEASVADWSPNGKRIVYSWADDGDPIFVVDQNGFNPTQIFSGDEGKHNHYPIWSPDERWIYFVSGPIPESNMDLWRIRSDGSGHLERLTNFERFMSHPTPIDARTVLYIGTDKDGSGPWLWAFDIEGTEPRRVSVDIYNSISRALHGHRLIASRINPEANLRSVPVLDRIAEETDVSQYSVGAARALMPRFGKESLFFVSSEGGYDGLWRVEDGKAVEIWKDSESALLVPPAISRDGTQAVVVVPKKGKRKLFLITVDTKQARPLAETFEVQGSVTWSPDGKWIAAGGKEGQRAGLFRIPVDGGAPLPLVRGPAMNPVWAPDNRFIAYVGPIANAVQRLQAVSPEGADIQLPLIQLGAGGERMQFLPNGKSLIYMQGTQGGQDFWKLDLTTMAQHRLTHLDLSFIMRTFDITPDGKRLVFDRRRDHSDIVQIDLAAK